MSDKEFKYFDGIRTLLGSGQELFQSRVTGRACIIPADVAATAALCKNFATIKDHANRLDSMARATFPSTPELWERNLIQAVENGLLLSRDDVRNRIVDGLASLPRDRVIDVIAVPTRNRPEMLKRVLSGIASNLRDFGRKSVVLIIDDSESSETQKINREVISLFSADPAIDVRFGNRRTRKQFASLLAKRSGTREEIASFAILPHQKYTVSTGACRNAILLEALGHCLLYMDDDVECRFAAIPDSNNKITLGGNAGSFSSWFFLDREQILAYPFKAENLLGLHEKVLNVDRTVAKTGTMEGGNVDLSLVSTPLLKRMENGSARVVISLMGIIGDTGMDHPLPYFLQGGESLNRLTMSEELYRAALKNRMVLCGPRTTAVNHRMSCMSYCMGVDNSEALPPFMPVQRSQEAVFASLVSRCLPNALFGAIPKAILHDPPGLREFEPDAAVLYAGKFSTGTTLSLLVTNEPILGLCPRTLMGSLGSRLRELSRLPDREFQYHINATVRPAVGSLVRQFDAILHSRSGKSAFWLEEDVQRMKAACLSCFNERDYSVPFDLERTWGLADGRQRFRCLLEQFSDLLLAWPALVEGAKALHANGVAACLPPSEWRHLD